MAKIVKFLLIFLCAICLHAGEYDEFFTKFDKTFKSANLQEQQNLHNELKNVYLRTSTGSQKEYRIDALKRLIFSSKALDYNANSYESELKRLGGEYDYPANLTLTKKENSTKNSQNVALNSPKNSSNELEKLKPQNSNSQNSQPIIVNSQNPKEIKTVKKLDPKTAKLSLNSAQVSQNELMLEFNREISPKEFKNFVLQNSERYRFVIDFDGVQNSKNKLFNGILVDEIRIAQRDLKSVRIVLSSIEKFSANLGFDKNILTIKVVQNTQKIANSEKKTDNINSQNNTKKTASTPAPISRTPGTATTTSTKYNSTKGKIIVIDPGHGGKDPGALGNGLKEKTIVLNTAKKLGELLKKRGYKVHYTRSNDTFINLKSRTAFANKKNADMFISIHTNAAPNKKQAPNFSGVETFFLSPARSERSKNAAALENKGDLEDMNEFSQETFLNFLNREKIIASNKLAIDIQGYILNSVQSKFKSKDGGVREAPFWVLVGATMPAVLIELGYISHPDEGKLLGKNEYQNALANGIANDVDAYFHKNK